MSNGTITLSNSCGKFDLDVTTFQMAVLFCWENRRHERLTLENLRLATELPDSELRRTLWSLIAMPKLKRQILLVSPEAKKASDINENSQVSKRNHGGTIAYLLVLYPITRGNNSSVYLNKTSDLERISATDPALQRPLQERFGDTNSAFGKLYLPEHNFFLFLYQIHECLCASSTMDS